MIIQGTDLPLYLEFDGNAEEFQAISVVLINHRGYIEKRWTKDDLIITGRRAAAELTEQETMGFLPGACTISMKWRDEEGVPHFANDISQKIVAWPDRSTL